MLENASQCKFTIKNKKPIGFSMETVILLLKILMVNLILLEWKKVNHIPQRLAKDTDMKRLLNVTSLKHQRLKQVQPGDLKMTSQGLMKHQNNEKLNEANLDG